MLNKAFRVVLTVMLLAGCSDPTGVRQDGIEFEIDASGLTIHNGRSNSIYIFAADAQTAALILWAPCIDPATCDSIGAGATRKFDKETVIGWGASNEVIVWWWHLVPASEGGFKMDSVRSVRVNLGN